MPWDSDVGVLPNACSNLVMGRAILGVLLHPAARSLSMVVGLDNLEQVTNTGVTEKVNEYIAIDV